MQICNRNSLFHLLVPLEARSTYEEIQKGVGGVCRFLGSQRPQECTVERNTRHREGKVYLDYLQNGRSRTMAGIYSVRPTPFGNVSAPLLWEEVERGVEYNKKTADYSADACT